MNAVQPIETVETVIHHLAWQAAAQAPDVLETIHEFIEDGLEPLVYPGEQYHFISINELPWPHASDLPLERRLEEAPSLFVRTYPELGLTPGEILFACTEGHGEVLILKDEQVRRRPFCR